MHLERENIELREENKRFAELWYECNHGPSKDNPLPEKLLYAGLPPERPRRRVNTLTYEGVTDNIEYSPGVKAI